MNRIDVMELMASSRSEEEWNANCDKVKAACGGHYPDFWFGAVIISGLMRLTLGPGADEIQVSASPDAVEAQQPKEKPHE